MQTVNREELLHQLESVQPGLSTREIIEQSSCCVFTDGKVMTYNDEIACTKSTSLKLTGAVQAAPLLAILRKLTEDQLDVEIVDDELVLHGKKRQAHIRCESVILLPIDKVEVPKGWKKLPEEFLEAIGMVQHCASKDESRFDLTCIHLHPHFVEACDNFQLTRVDLDLDLEEEVLVRRDSIKHIVSLQVTEFSETLSWIHFRNPAGLVLSCRRFVESYKDLAPVMDFKGHPISIPKGLSDAADKAQVFSAENSEDNYVTVELRTGRLRITGKGATGWYRETKELQYEGPPLKFVVAPQLLIELTKKHNQAEITDGRLKVDGGKWIYVTRLAEAEQKPVE